MLVIAAIAKLSLVILYVVGGTLIFTSSVCSAFTLAIPRVPTRISNARGSLRKLYSKKSDAEMGFLEWFETSKPLNSFLSPVPGDRGIDALWLNVNGGWNINSPFFTFKHLKKTCTLRNLLLSPFRLEKNPGVAIFKEIGA
jgi:hypothetical protein